MPVNYAQFQQGVANPLQQALAGYQASTALQQQRAVVAQQEASRQQALQMRSDLAVLSSNPNAGAKDFASMMTKYPTMSKHFKDAFNILDTKSKEVKQKQAVNLFSMLQAGQNKLAAEMLEEQKTAAENAGRAEDAAGAEAMLQLIETNPNAAKTSAGLMLSATMGADQFASVLDKINVSAEAQFRVLTPAEKKGLGLSAKEPFQIGLDGKISKIGGSWVEGQSNSI